MRNAFLHDPSAAFCRGGAAVCAMGASLPGRVVTPLVRSTEVFLSEPPKAIPVVKTAQPAFHNDKYTTRINAAGGGAAGSPPTWDPV